MTRRPTQRRVVERLLRTRGAAGVGAHELTYQHGITRAAAIVHTLRRHGWDIETIEEHGGQAVYVLRGAPRAPRPVPPPEPPALGADGPPVTWAELADRLR